LRIPHGPCRPDRAFLPDIVSRAGKFEAPHVLTQVSGCGDKMRMVFEDDVAVDSEAGFLLQETPGVQDDIHGFRTGKEWKPVIDRSGQEVRRGFADDAVAASGHG
jgi:hypothetical protein